MAAQQKVMCERCHRMRYKKHMNRAVYWRIDLVTGRFVDVGQSEAWRCVARASCNNARKAKP